MDVLVQSCHVEIRRLVLIIGIIVASVVVLQCSVLPNWKNISVSSPDKGSIAFVIRNETHLDDSRFTLVNTSNSHEEGEDEEESEEEKEDYDLTLDFNKHLGDSFYKFKDQNSRNEFILEKNISNGKSLPLGNVPRMENSSSQAKTIEMGYNLPEPGQKTINSYKINDEAKESDISGNAPVTSSQDPREEIEKLNANSKTSDVLVTAMSLTGNVKQTMETQKESDELLQTVSVILSNNSLKARISLLQHRKKQSISITQMDSIFVRGLISSRSNRPRWSSPRDRELLSAKREIENAPILRDTPGLYASVFRNISRFRRSYDLMERVLKVYVYKEGQKPIFHQPKMRGIYASEGWFMKLIEGNKNFIVRDPRKAHLFYLPVSIKNLRSALGQDFQSPKDLKGYLKKYAELIAGKYKFWNRTGGADHFLVACHDWAPKLTNPHMKNCIRALCNANAAEGFNIGKDTTLPVTYIRSVEAPLEHLGGKPSSERHILAFFAGSMHGYLRPILLQLWEKKEADMKIFGPMPRDIEGRRNYREHMKSSKYCICARGYEVHTPRVVEAIFYECVPVIISDNYVPPFFEVLNWEAFAVFVREKDIPNLRNILLSIPEEKHRALQSRVKMVQQHFLWHKKPVKYDLFHMALHSIWHNRVFQIKTR